MNILTISIIVVGVFNFLLGAAFFNFKNGFRENRIYFAFSLLAFNVALWTFLVALLRLVPDSSQSNLIFRLMYASSTFIPAFYLYFVVLFLRPEGKEHKRNLLNIIPFVLSGILFFIILFSNAIVVRIVFLQGFSDVHVFFGPAYFLYVVNFIVTLCVAFYLLIRNYFVAKGGYLWKKQIVASFSSVFVTGFFAVGVDIILPIWGVFQFYWLGPLFTFIFVLFILYAIQKYQFLNVKIIFAELIVGAIWVFLLVRYLVESRAFLRVFDMGVLVLSIIFGSLLIQSVKKEALQRERFQKIAGEITATNDELQALDRQKTEFISLASHQLRTPLTAVKGYASMLVEGSFGKLPGKAEDAVGGILDESEVLARSVENLLVASRIEQGRVQYTFSEVDFKEIAKSVSDFFKPNAEEKNIELTFESYNEETYEVHGDKEKLSRVVHNLVQNAVDHTEGGFIHVLLVQDAATEMIRLSVSDTGAGMSGGALHRVFQSFQDDTLRLDHDQTVKTGMALYISGVFVKAHGGKIWGESPGIGKGTTFFIEIPMLRKYQKSK